MTSPELSTEELLLARSIETSETLLPIQTSPTSPGDGAPSSDMGPEERYSDPTQIGAGGMGEILMIRDRRIGRGVALKRLHAQINSQNALGRFVREARIQGQLEHPSIVPVYDMGTDRDGSTYFTMRHIRGRTLEQVLRALQAGHQATVVQFTRRKLLTLFSTICLTIHYAHSRGVLHRDIKPSNIMVGEFGEVYVLDWGIAKVVGQKDEPVRVTTQARPELNLDLSQDKRHHVHTPNATAVGSVMGTLGYMSPEQLKGDIDRLDARSDIYALGMILFEMLTFQRFHSIEDPKAAYERTLRGYDLLPSQRAADVPPELDELFRKATALDPEQRFATARALSNAVEHHLDGDRDLLRRRELAEGHAARAAEAAETALASGVAPETASASRLLALGEITKALALDPGQARAHAALGRLLAEMPKELPPAVKQAMDRSTHEAQMNGLRFGSIVYLSWVAVIAYVLFMGVQSWAAFAGPTVGVALILALVARLFLKGSMSSFDGRLLATLTFGTIATFSVWLGPFILVPLATACGALVFSIQAARRDRLYMLISATVASVLPYLVEFSGLFPPAYAFRGGELVLFPRAVQLSPTLTLAGLIYLSASFTFVPAYYLSRVRDSLASAEEKLFLHAWHFEQLTGPKKAPSDEAKKPKA